jgi:hypothetical protein
VIAAIETTPESKIKARKRRRARKRATAAVTGAAAGAARAAAAAPATAGRKVKKADAGKKARKATSKRRRRSKKMKGMGKLGMVVGAAVGYVLGAKAGRERYEQLTASARQLLDKPQVKKVMDSVPGDLSARVEQAANKAADKVQEAGDKVAAGGSGTSGSTSGSTTTTTTASTTTPATPATPAASTTTTTTPSVPSTEGGTTTKRSSASERKPKSS